jgi:hypothetical protein
LVRVQHAIDVHLPVPDGRLAVGVGADRPILDMQVVDAVAEGLHEAGGVDPTGRG